MGTAARLEALVELTASKLTSAGLARLLARWGLEAGSFDEAYVELVPRSEAIFRAERIQGIVKVHDLESSLFDLESIADPAQTTELLVCYEETTYARLLLRAASGVAKGVADDATFLTLAHAFGYLLHERASMERVADLAIRDELTGCFNRRYLRQALDHWLPRARAERFPVSVFLLDVDHFKSFNDRFGHAVGDRVLKMLGTLMQNLFRSQDVVCRYGGEEFAVLLCDHRSEKSTDHPHEVFHFAERLRRAAEKLRLVAGEMSHPADPSLVPAQASVLSHITISGGIATFPWDASSAEGLLQKADEALYQAKHDGRNRIYLAQKLGLVRAA